MKKTNLLVICILILFTGYLLYFQAPQNNLPIVAIANYGPHSSLEDSLKGFKVELANQGFVENKNVKFEYADVGFDANLIPQMLAKLSSIHPKLILTVGTPISQFAKGSIKNIPLIFNVVTDPVEAGLLTQDFVAEENVTGASDKQDFNEVLKFSKLLMPNAQNVGVLYATSEVNDLALIKMLQEAAEKNGFKLNAIAVDQPREIPLKMQSFKNAVDFIYVGTSGTIQPALPAIIAEADKMKIPVINVNEEAVLQKMALASFGVNYYQVGANAGLIASKVLNGQGIGNITPSYPDPSDHIGFISKERAAFFGISIPNDLQNVSIVE